MRKNIFMAVIASALLCLSQIMSAVPAKPGKFTRTQPDGTTITVQVHGDEWFHYVTDENGNLLEEDSTGKLVLSHKTFESLKENMVKAQATRQTILAQSQEVLLKAQASGSPKIPVILVQFKDKSFSISNPKTAFTNLLSQQGYSANGGTGSVLDYYKDQSRGAYSPQFVVMDVVTLSNNMSTYGSSDSNAAKALYEACQALDSSVDFSQFDNDGDGKIDMALMYFAGYNEAEGAPSSTIWPHQYYVPYVVTNAQAFDGVYLDRYFCTSELKGYYGTYMCGIGTTCHEFAHSLGLPDFYDTNYNKYGDGEAGATYEYDVMCSGAYNNDGCTPPWMNAEELEMLGWATCINELTNSGKVLIPSIGVPNPIAYKTPTSVDGEYFLYECRPGTGWDAPLSPGLLVYHVDKAKSHTVTRKDSYYATSYETAYNLWAKWESTNAINASGSHPCFYIIPSGNTTSLNYGGSLTFPGSGKVTSYIPIEWSGSETGFALSQIAFDSTTKTVTFQLSGNSECSISGNVLDSSGTPVQGATVSIRATSTVQAPSNNSIMTTSVKKSLIKRVGGSVLKTVTTDADGAYSFVMDEAGTYIIEVSNSGFVSKSATLDISSPTIYNFYLLRTGEQLPSEVYTYPDDGEEYGLGFGETPCDIMCANYYPASMLGVYEGKQINSLSFLVYGDANNNGKAYALLDFGSDRKVKVEVSNPVSNDWNTVDLRDMNLIIPSGKDIFAGYAIKNWACEYPLATKDAANSTLQGYWANFNLSSTAWTPAGEYVFVIKLNIGDPAEPETGYNFIEDPNNGVYPVGADFALSLKETETDRRPSNAGINWFYDDEPVSGDSVKLSTAGNHTVTAKFTTESGTQKVIELELKVQ